MGRLRIEPPQYQPFGEFPSWGSRWIDTHKSFTTARDTRKQKAYADPAERDAAERAEFLAMENVATVENAAAENFLFMLRQAVHYQPEHTRNLLFELLGDQIADAIMEVGGR